MEPPVVKDNIAGSEVIDINIFRRRLGLTAFEVWVAFLWRRNKEGHSYASARSLAVSKNLPYTSVRRACQKLVELCIVKEGKWIMQRNGNKRFRRTVVGDYRNGIILIPEIASVMIKAKPSWGGAREGAGRPYKDAPPIGGVSTHIQVGQGENVIRGSSYIQVGTTVIQDERTLKSSIKRYKDYNPLKGVIMSVDDALDFSSFSDTLDIECLEPGEEAPPVMRESSLVDSNHECAPNQPPTKDRRLESHSDDSFLKRSEEHNEGSDMKETNEESIRETPYIQVGQGSNPTIEKTMPIPPYPSVGFIGVPKIPPPPSLSSDLSDEASVKKLAEAYRGAFESRYNKRSYVMTRGSVKRSKFYKSLVASAHFMRENDIAPASWAAFSLDSWISFSEKNEGAKTKPPPVNWVFSMKRLEERLGWFDREASSYGGGRLLFTRKHKDILRRYDGLKRAAQRELITEALIEKWFPGGWEKHYDMAKKEAAADQARLRDIVRRGDFVW